MKIIGLFISLLLHAGLILLALTWSVSLPVKISLDMPVYKVDLVSLAPLPAAPAVKKAPAPKVAPKLSKPNAVAIPEAKPKAAPKVKPESTKTPAPKPAPKPKPKPKPKPDTQKISPKKVKTTAKKKPEKKVEKPVEKKAPPKKAEPKKTETQKVDKKTPPKKAEKKVEKKPEVSAEDALAADLASLAKLVDKQEKAERQAVASDLASLTKSAEATAVTGSADGTAGASGLVQVYASIVKEAVRKNWRYPVFGQKQNLMARVEIQLKSNGEISNIKLLDSSGNVDFDDSVITALRDTEVLPKPPGTSIRNLVVNFNLHDLDQ